jgi:hypothetical protein
MHVVEHLLNSVAGHLLMLQFFYLRLPALIACSLVSDACPVVIHKLLFAPPVSA